MGWTSSALDVNLSISGSACGTLSERAYEPSDISRQDKCLHAQAAEGMSAVETGWMSSAGTTQMTAVERRQMSAVQQKQNKSE